MRFLVELIEGNGPILTQPQQQQFVPEPHHDEYADEDEDRATISFGISNEGGINLKFHWDENIETADMLGKLLHVLNSGHLVDRIATVLNQKILEEPGSEKFVYRVISSWKEGMGTIESPVVNSLKTFNIGRQGM